MPTTKKTTSGEAAFLIADFPVSLRLRLKTLAKKKDVSLRELVIMQLKKAVN